MSFSLLLTQARAARGLSQEELAAAATVSVRAISNLERGLTRPRSATVRALADGLGLDGATRARFEAEAGLAATREAVSGAAVGLPAPLTELIGRHREVAALCRLVHPGTRARGASRAVTVTGTGGVGKSRLALAVAWRISRHFAAVNTVDVSPLRNADGLVVALAAAVGCPTGEPVTVASVAARIGTAPVLLLLDGLEHVPAAAGVLGEVLHRSPRLHLLMTSRSPIGLPVERCWPLAPLPVPDSGADVAGNPAVALLVERVRAVDPAFAVTDTNADAVAALCRRLDGLPLAIELAAARLDRGEPAALAAQLADRAVTLRADAVDVPGRHRTLRAMVEWSTVALTRPARLTFTALGAFRGAADPAAVHEILTAAGLACDRSRDAIADLVTASLVVTDPAGRVRMLDTIREVAADLLRESGHDQRIRAAHARHMFGMVGRTVAAGEPLAARADVDDIRAAAGWATTHAPELIDTDLVQALDAHFTAFGRFAEAHRVLRAIADAAPGPAARAAATLRAGIDADRCGEHGTALELAARAEELFSALADADGVCSALALAGTAHKWLGDLDRATDAFQRCLRTATGAGNRRYALIATNNLGTIAHDRGQYDLARRHYTANLEMRRAMADPKGIAVALHNLGELAWYIGEFVTARDHLADAVRRFRDLQSPHIVAWGLALLAQAHLGLGDLPAARDAALEAAALGRDIEHPHSRGLTELALGDIALASGDPLTADAHFTAAMAVTTQLSELARIHERLAAARAGAAPADAARHLTDAEQIRRAHGYPVPPVERDAVARVRTLLR